MLIELFNCLKQTHGLKTLAILRNQVGNSTMNKIVKGYIPCLAFKGLKKFIIKDPMPFKVVKKFANAIPAAINKQGIYLDNMNKLVLCKIGMST